MESGDLTQGLTVSWTKNSENHSTLDSEGLRTFCRYSDGRTVTCGLGAGVREFPVASPLIMVPTVPIFLGFRSFPGCGAFRTETWQVLGKVGHVDYFDYSNFNVP